MYQVLVLLGCISELPGEDVDERFLTASLTSYMLTFIKENPTLVVLMELDFVNSEKIEFIKSIRFQNVVLFFPCS